LPSRNCRHGTLRPGGPTDASPLFSEPVTKLNVTGVYAKSCYQGFSSKYYGLQ
jgi:hypothetical protein